MFLSQPTASSLGRHHSQSELNHTGFPLEKDVGGEGRCIGLEILRRWRGGTLHWTGNFKTLEGRDVALDWQCYWSLFVLPSGPEA